MNTSPQRRKILYIAYYFPPLGLIASHRSLKMVKYLAELGIDSVVLTLNPFGMRLPRDTGLLKEIPGSTKIYRFRCFDPSWIFKLMWGLKLHNLVAYIQHRFLLPDSYILGLPSAKRKLRQLLDDDREIECAVVSGGPFSAFLLGLLLKRKYQIPFICDWRDEWTNNPERINIDYPQKAQNKELLWEARVLSAAAGNVFLTSHMSNNFLAKYTSLRGKPSRIIPNGFDESDFPDQPEYVLRTYLRIVYTGSFYDRRQPDRLWQAITELSQAGQITDSELMIDIIGKNNPRFVFGSYVDDPQLRSMVCLKPFTTHSESITEMYHADALLLYIPSGANTDSVLTGKIFDYLRTGKPILAIIPPKGLAAECLTKAGTGLIADYDDLNEIKTRIMKLLELWRSDSLAQITADCGYISQFSRQRQASSLAELIREVIGDQAT